jgi:hypothetical protein
MRSMAAAGGAFAVKSRTTRATGRPCTTSGAFATPISTVDAAQRVMIASCSASSKIVAGSEGSRFL